jgi:L-lactate dehydrogenase complex protein LldG
MNNTVRERILTKLKNANAQAAGTLPIAEKLPVKPTTQAERVDEIKKRLEAVRAEVHVVNNGSWVETVKAVLAKRSVKTLLYAPETTIGKTIAGAFKDKKDGLPELVPYQESIENFKPELFQIDAAITSTIGGIAETGALILWPTVQEPKLMSLIPPIHIAILDANKIYQTFTEAIEKENWSEKSPLNALLISGPSKTADIELVLAFGVHGPKELVVVIV